MIWMEVGREIERDISLETLTGHVQFVHVNRTTLPNIPIFYLILSSGLCDV